MSWILTQGCHAVDLQRPEPHLITAPDIAHSLAQINRFTGHARRPYSVAEHSLLVLEIVQRLFAVDVHGQLAALLHDAHEAYVGDMSTPAKGVVGECWQHMEDRARRAVRSAFGLHSAAHVWRDWIKQADTIALATERLQLLPEGGPLWQSLVHVMPCNWIDLMAPERVAMSWADWRDRWADAYDELDYARNDKIFPVSQP